MASYNSTSKGTTILRDQQHADHLFNVDQFRLAPKHSFLFHVAFGINRVALGNATLVQRHSEEINMLVKSIDLPNYKINTQVLNQYNRKKLVQSSHAPGEIGIKFHDDNLGVINQLWQAYYKYYYADPTTAWTPGAYERNATKAYSSAMPGKYGFDNGSTRPFFNYIKIYQMSRHEYVLHQLWNPMITSFNHNRVAYSETGVHDFDMKIMYEAVSYDTGDISDGNPEGFGTSHYDHTASPIANGPAGNNVSFVGQTALNSLGGGILNNVINTIGNYQNPTGLILGSLAAGAAVSIGAKLVGSAISGLSGFSFPGASSTNSSNTQAGTAGTDSANIGENPSADETSEYDNASPNTGDTNTDSTAEDITAPVGTEDNPSSASDQDTADYSYDF